MIIQVKCKYFNNILVDNSYTFTPYYRSGSLMDSINARITAKPTPPPLATVTPTLNQRRLQRSSAIAKLLFSNVFNILCAESSGVEIQSPLPTTLATLKHRSGGETGP